MEDSSEIILTNDFHNQPIIMQVGSNNLKTHPANGKPSCTIVAQSQINEKMEIEKLNN